MDNVENSTTDRLSDLPDPLLHRIMPLLKAREAVRTCIWSKRWEKFWFSLPCLNFDMREFKSDDSEEDNKLSSQKFIKFVKTFLERCDNQAYLDTFQICCKELDEELYHPSVRDWILYAIDHNPRVIRIEYSYNCGILPRSIFTCESLENLYLNLCCWKHIEEIAPDMINLPRLKKLHLQGPQNHCHRGDFRYECDMEYDIHDYYFLEKLLSGTPEIEDLWMESMPNIKGDISSKKLKHLTIKSRHRCMGIINSMNTPSLESFRYIGSISCLGQVRFESRPSIVNAYLCLTDFTCGNAESRICHILRALSYVETLELFLWLYCNEMCETFDIEDLPKFNKLKNLSFFGNYWNNCFGIAVGILKHSPNLENLTLWHNGGDMIYDDQNGAVKGNLWDIAILKCKKIKKIEVKYCTYNDKVKRDVDSLCETMMNHQNVKIILSLSAGLKFD